MSFPYVLPGRPVTTSGANLDGASAGNKLTYTAPSGKPAICVSAGIRGAGAATRIDLVFSDATISNLPMVAGAAGADWRSPTLNIAIDAGESVAIRTQDVTLTNVYDAYIGILEAP